jgi:hypothetical protein
VAGLEEIFVDATPAADKCTRLCVMSVEKTVKFLLSPVGISQYIVVSVLRKRRVEVQEDQAEEALEGLILEKEMIPTKNYWNRLAL